MKLRGRCKHCGKEYASVDASMKCPHCGNEPLVITNKSCKVGVI